MNPGGILATASRTEIRHWAEIKFGLLAEGAVIEAGADAQMHDVKRPIRTRSGVSGGLDIRIGDWIDVNVPVVESVAQESSFALGWDSDEFVVKRHGERLCTYEPLPTPGFYAAVTEAGSQPMHRIAQMCSADRLCYGMTGPTCYFWARKRRCQYCTIGKNYSEDAVRKQSSQMMEVLAAALADDRLPAKHILIGGGTPPGDDMGAVLAAELAQAIKERFPQLSIYVMIAAPLDDKHLKRLHDVGVDEIGLNLEFWSPGAWERYIPGKHAEIGKERYLAALDYCAGLFGPIRTRSIVIAGLEPLECTYEAATFLAGLGVMPVVSPFRPLAGATLEDERGASGAEYVELWERIDADIHPLGIPLGPACIACQNNTLALPTDARYRHYAAQ